MIRKNALLHVSVRVLSEGLTYRKTLTIAGNIQYTGGMPNKNIWGRRVFPQPDFVTSHCFVTAMRRKTAQERAMEQANCVLKCLKM